MTNFKFLNKSITSVLAIISANDSGVVIKKFGGFLICLALLYVEVSLVRVSTLIFRFKSLIGFIKFLWISEVKAFKGDMYKV